VIVFVVCGIVGDTLVFINKIILCLAGGLVLPSRSTQTQISLAYIIPSLYFTIIMSQSKFWVFTLNNYTPDEYSDISSFIEGFCDYGIVGKEQGDGGTPHLQGYVCFVNALTLASVKEKLPGCWVEVMKGSLSENDTYISKLIDPFERGDKPMTNDNKGRAEQLRWKRSLDLAKEGKIEEIDADIQLRYFSTLKKIKAEYATKVLPCDNIKCFWIYGKTGTGKSHAVYAKYPDAYRKEMSDFKWYDNYNGESAVYLEDLDKYDVKWAGHIKRLSDKWPLKVQVKGSMVDIRPNVVIITSNYKIEEIWDDAITQECLKRRFTIFEKLNKHEILFW